MVEAVIRLARPELDLSSAGVDVNILGMARWPAHEYARQACAEAGLDINLHRGRQLASVDSSTVLLALDPYVEKLCRKIAPKATVKRWTLPDPIGGTLEEFRETLKRIMHSAAVAKK